jgi:hypothetical protein
LSDETEASKMGTMLWLLATAGIYNLMVRELETMKLRKP